jgi:hypothetical protein
MFGTLDNNEIEALLSNQVIGHLACHADNRTYVVPISYAYDGMYVYAHTWEGMKMDIMRKNRQVCFEVEDLKDMANWKTVIAWGEFEELKEIKERNKALHILMNRILPLISSETTHLSDQWPFPPDNISDIKGIVFRVFLKEKTGRFENNTVISI